MTRTDLRLHVSFIHSVEENCEPLALYAKGFEEMDIRVRNTGLTFGTECFLGRFVVLRRTGKKKWVDPVSLAIIF